MKSSGRRPAPEETGVGMGIILIMAVQMILVTESSVQVSDAEQLTEFRQQVNPWPWLSISLGALFAV